MAVSTNDHSPAVSKAEADLMEVRLQQQQQQLLLLLLLQQQQLLLLVLLLHILVVHFHLSVQAAVVPCVAAIDSCQTNTTACLLAMDICNYGLLIPYQLTGLNPYVQSSSNHVLLLLLLLLDNM